MNWRDIHPKSVGEQVTDDRITELERRQEKMVWSIPWLWTIVSLLAITVLIQGVADVVPRIRQKRLEERLEAIESADPHRLGRGPDITREALQR